MEGPASCKWWYGWTGLLQMVIQRGWHLAYDDPEGPASCRWSSISFAFSRVINNYTTFAKKNKLFIPQFNATISSSNPIPSGRDIHFIGIPKNSSSPSLSSSTSSSLSSSWMYLSCTYFSTTIAIVSYREVVQKMSLHGQNEGPASCKRSSG